MNRVFKKIKYLFRKKTKKNKNPIKWGIIGTGYMAEVFSSAIDNNKNGIVYAVASRSIEKARLFSKKHGNCNFFGSYSEMISNPNLDIDVIYIATPTTEHYKNIKECLLSGKNVLCEKPITCNSQEFEELVFLAKSHNCFLMEGMWMKCLPTFSKASEWIENGLIGKISLIKVDFYKRAEINTKYAIYDKNRGGGVLRDYGVYALAFALTFLNGVTELSSKKRLSAFDIDADWQIYMKNNGVESYINISSNFGGISKASVIGDQGSIEWESPFNRTNKVCLFNNKGSKIDNYSAIYTSDGFEYEINEVQDVLKHQGKQSGVVPLSFSLCVMKVLDELNKEGDMDNATK